MQATSPIAQTSPGPLGRRQRLVDHDAAALADRQPGLAGQLVARTDAGGEDDHVDRRAASRRRSPSGSPGRRRRRAAVAVAVEVRTVTPSFSISRRSASPPPSSTWSGISRGANSTTVVSTPIAVSAPAASRPSRPPPTTAPRTGRFRLRVVAQPRSSRDVVDGAVDEAAGQVAARHRRHDGDGAGGEHQRVVRRRPGRGACTSRRSVSMRWTGGVGVQPHALGGARGRARRAAGRRGRGRRSRRSARPGRTAGAAPRRRRRPARRRPLASRSVSASTSRWATMPPPTTTSGDRLTGAGVCAVRPCPETYERSISSDRA